MLSLDPDNMPYGPRTPDEVQRLILASARATLPYEPAAIVVACNTASVHGLGVLRAELEPDVPVIGTVPAIRPAAAAGGPVAIWSTAATTSSDYLRGLVDAFAADVETYAVAALGLAEAIESGDRTDVDACIAYAVSRTPAGVRSLVLGCTHYGLVVDRIVAALGRRGDDPRLSGRGRPPDPAPHRPRARPDGPRGRRRGRAPQWPPGALPTSWALPRGRRLLGRAPRRDRPERTVETGQVSRSPASFRPVDPAVDSRHEHDAS